MNLYCCRYFLRRCAPVVGLLLLGGAARLPATVKDPAMEECFWARRLVFPAQNLERTFFPTNRMANFTSFKGVTNVTVAGESLRFTLTADRAILGWGNYAGAQAPADIADLWEQRNDIELRVKQSGTNSVWTMSYWVDGSRLAKRGGAPPLKSVPDVFRGSDWKKLVFKESGSQVPTPDGLEFIIQARRGDTFEIAHVKAVRPTYTGVCRKEFVLPTNKVWRAVAAVAGMADGTWTEHCRMRAALFVNGQFVKRHSASQWTHTTSVDLAPYLQPGTNCVGFDYYGVAPYDPDVYLQLKVVLDSGEILTVQTDDTWKFVNQAPTNWNQPGVDDAAWQPAKPRDYINMIARRRSYFAGNVHVPEYDGRIVIRNPERRELYYSDREEVVFDVCLPPGVAAQAPVVEYDIGKADANGVSAAVVTGRMDRFEARDGALVGRISSGKLAGGVYTLALTLKAGATVVEERPREPFMVIRQLDQRIVAGANYCEGLDLELEDTVDFTDPADPHPRFEARQVVRGRETVAVTNPVLVRKSGLVYREGAEGRGSMFSYRLNNFKHPGDFYLMELEYPDDAERDFDVSIASKIAPAGANTQTGTGVGTGGKYRLTRGMQKLHWLHVADHGVHSVDIANCADKITKAAARSLKIYHVKGDLPAVQFATNRLWGSHNERCYYTSGHGLNFGMDTPRPRAQEEADQDSLPPMQRFIKDLIWMRATADKYAQYLKFAGQNTHMIGVWQYNRMNAGLVRDSDVRTSRLVPCLKRVLAHTLDQNQIAFGASVEFISFDDMFTFANNAQVARGTDTVWVVNAQGAQSASFSRKRACMNWLHPAVRSRFNDLMRELAGVFDLPHFLGVQLFVGAPDLLYPFNSASIESENIYDDYSFAAFAGDTGARLPFANTGPGRFARRGAYLKAAENKAAFRTWRCQAAHKFITEALGTLKEQRADLGLMCVMCGPFSDGYAYWRKNNMSFRDYLRSLSIDPALFAQTPDLWLSRFSTSWSHYDGLAHRNPLNWLANTAEEVTQTFASDRNRAVFISISQDENDVGSPGYKARGTQAENLVKDDWILDFYKIRANPQPSLDSAREAFVQALIASDPDRLIFGFSDLNLPIGHEQELREFARVFTALPREKFKPVLNTDLRSNVAIRQLQEGDKAYFYVANPGNWPLNATLTLKTEGRITNLTAATSAHIGRDAGGAQQVDVALPPFGVAAFRVDTPQLEIVSWTVAEVPETELKYFRDIMAEIEALLADEAIASSLDAADVDFLRAQLADIRSALARKEYALAYSLLTHYRFWFLFQDLQIRNTPQTVSLFVIKGWKVSAVVEPHGSISNASYVIPDMAKGWKPLPSDSPETGRIYVHDLFGDQAGWVYLANRIQVRVPGKYSVRMGHDGGANIFIDGKAVACDPRTRSPITPDRTQAEVELSAGAHDVLVAFDLASGKGGGIRFRFGKTDNQPIRLADFPSAAGL